MKKLILGLGLLFASISALSQVSPQIQGAGAPANPCVNGGQQYVDTTNHIIYNCSVPGQNWVNIGLGNLSGSSTGGGAFISGAAGTGFQDVTEIAAPANPAAGIERVYSDSTTHLLTCIRSSGANCFASSGSSAFSSITSGTNITAAMVVGSGASMVANSGSQLTGDSNWVPFAIADNIPPAPTSLVGALTGGTLGTGSNVYVRLTFVGPAVILPGPEMLLQLNATTNCASASLCTVTVNMPSACTSPVAPATGCTVWSGPTSGTEKQQAASAACVNITAATCVIGTRGAGANLSASVSTTSGINPPNLITTTIPDFIIPGAFMQKANGYYPLWGIDNSALNLISCCYTAQTVTVPTTGGTNSGTFTWLDRFFVNDDNTPPPISNSLVSIKHQSGATTSTLTSPGAGVDDRSLSIRLDNDLTTNPNYEQYLGQYNETFVDASATTCAPIADGSAYGESCAAGLRAIATDKRPAATNPVRFVGVAGVANSFNTTANNPGGDYSFTGIQGGAFQSAVSTAGAGGTWAGGVFGVLAAASNTAGSGVGVLIQAPAVRFATANFGLKVKDEGTNIADWNIVSASANGNTSGRNLLQGNVWLSNLVADNSTIAVQGSLNATGGLTTTQLASQLAGGFALSTFGTSGATTNTYKTTCVDSNLSETTAAASSNIATANADLTAAHGDTITFSTLSATTNMGCSSFNIYRTVSGSTCNGGACTNGKIGNVAASLIGQSSSYSAVVSFADTGQAGDGNTAVAQANTTGGAYLLGLERDAGTCRLATDTVLTVNTVTSFCTFNLPASALVWAVRCEGIWAISAGTGTNTFALGVNASQTPAATTNIAATIETATASLTGTQAAVPLSASGATSVLTSGTITPAATLEQFQLTGTISANAAAGTFAVTATAAGTTATAAVKAGTQCRIF